MLTEIQGAHNHDNYHCAYTRMVHDMNKDVEYLTYYQQYTVITNMYKEYK